MPRFRRSKSSSNTSPPTPTPPTPTPPVKLVRKLTSQRESTALAATSSAIALSISSAFSGADDTSSGGVTNQEGDTGWKTAYAAVRMAIEVTKESSDLCLPLKAVVGAMSVLTKNYDQASDNAENMKDIERRVHSLYGVLASPVSDDDSAEKARRVELRRRLDGVVAKLEPLSEQHVLLGFLWNVDNAKTLAGFVQELADAITDYQVSIQQGTHQRTRDIHDQTKHIINKAKDIQDDTENIRGNTKDIRSDTKVIHDNTKNILEAADLDILAKLEPVCGAGYQTGHHDKCLPGTRESVLKDLMIWAENPQYRNVFWLNGLAGTGKSTIAQSFSEAVANQGLLGASFFCSRDYLDRKELKNVFPTLAYQLACHYPHFRSHIISIIKNNPTLAHTSLISQLENLLVNPLSRKNISCIIVIDALDECIDNEPSSAILSVLGQFINQLSLVKFFITGRPEPRVRTGFRLPLLKPITQIFLLHEVDLASVDNDIQLYLTQKLTTIASQRSDLELPNQWPHDDEIKALTKKSSGLFIFAATMVRFIESGHHEPDQRLQLLLSEVDSTMHEGCSGIDSLYSQILAHAFSDVHEPEEFADIRHVLGAIVLAFNPLSRRELSIILGVSMSLISTTLRYLHSVILVPSDETKKICIFHKSFPDFLQDDKRCADTRLHINPETHHSNIALRCLELVKDLERNPCSLPPFVMNEDIQDLPQLLENNLGSGVQYACAYWAGHLRLSPTPGVFGEQIIDLATSVLYNAPAWIEVMSLENHLGEVIYSMNSLLDWLDQLPSDASIDAAHTVFYDPPSPPPQLDGSITILHNLATDCLRLSMHFFHPIQQCAQQVYHTALPLSPISSQLQKSCLQSVTDAQLSPVTAFIGAPTTWGLLLRTVNIRPSQLTCITTSGQGIIAACGDIVNIYDAVTGVLQQSLSAPETVIKMQPSPDGSTLFFAHSSSVTMWDVQTGGLIHTFTIKSKVSDIAISTSGGHIACGTSNGYVTFWNTRTKVEGKGFGNGQPVVTTCWLSPQKLAVATRNSLYIRNVTAGETLDSLSFPNCVWGMVYFGDKDEFLVGTSQPGQGGDQELCLFETISHRHPEPLEKIQSILQRGRLIRRKIYRERQSPTHLGQLTYPMTVGKGIVCITLPSGVQSFSPESYDWTSKPPLLDMAISVAVSLNRNLVAQTEDSIQIFSADVLTSQEVHNDVRPPQVYPLGKEYILCVDQPNKHLTLLESETLQELCPDDETLPFGSLLHDQSPSTCASFCSGLVTKISIWEAIRAWRLGSPLPEQIVVDERKLLYGLSPACTAEVMVWNFISRVIIGVRRPGHRSPFATLLDDQFRSKEVYNITFDSETRFYLKVDRPGQHVQIPYDISPSSTQYKITKGEPVPLLEPRETPPYTLDANCEWVLDAKSRKICWISPRNVRRGNDGHFWNGLSLIMVGEDGVVRKVSFKDPDC